MVVTARVDIYRLLKVLERFPGLTKPTMNAFIDEQCRLLISSSGKVPGLIQVSPPNHGSVRGQAAKKTGEKAISRDLAKVYANPGRVYQAIVNLGKPGAAKGYWKAIRAKNFRRAGEIARQISGLPSLFREDPRGFDDGAAHRRRRNRKTGRVGGRHPEMIVESGPLRRYHLQRVRKVGLLAYGWASDAGKLGQVRGVPAWVKRHGSALGIVRKIHLRDGYVVEITNSAPHAGSDEQRRANHVLGYRIAAIQRQMPFVARKLEKQLQGLLAAA